MGEIFQVGAWTAEANIPAAALAAVLVTLLRSTTALGQADEGSSEQKRNRRLSAGLAIALGIGLSVLKDATSGELVSFPVQAWAGIVTGAVAAGGRELIQGLRGR